MKKESQFQAELIRDIKGRFPGCVVLKNDASYMQGLPDLLILHEDKWAALECKRSLNSHKQPNQEHYVQKMNEMSYASFVCPENRDEVMNELQQTFGANRPTRVSRRK